MCHLQSVLSCVDHLDVKSYLSVDKVRIPEGLPMMFKPIMTMLLLNCFLQQCHLNHFLLISIEQIICLSLTNVEPNIPSAPLPLLASGETT